MSHRPPWDIPARARVCSRGAEPFTAGMEVHSRLVPLKGGEYERCDFCATCWTEERRQEPHAGQVAWRSLIPPREDKARGPVSSTERREQLLQWLREALERDSPEGQREAYILALYLVRLRHLVKRETVKRKDMTYTLYEGPDGDEALLVPIVSLSDEDADALEKRIAGTQAS